MNDCFRTTGGGKDKRFTLHLLDGVTVEWVVSDDVVKVIVGILEEAKAHEGWPYWIELGINTKEDTLRIPSMLFSEGKAWWTIKEYRN